MKVLVLKGRVLMVHEHLPHPLLTQIAITSNCS
jgi:hypothetical protein